MSATPPIKKESNKNPPLPSKDTQSPSPEEKKVSKVFFSLKPSSSTPQPKRTSFIGTNRTSSDSIPVVSNSSSSPVETRDRSKSDQGEGLLSDDKKQLQQQRYQKRLSLASFNPVKDEKKPSQEVSSKRLSFSPFSSMEKKERALQLTEPLALLPPITKSEWKLKCKQDMETQIEKRFQRLQEATKSPTKDSSPALDRLFNPTVLFETCAMSRLSLTRFFERLKKVSEVNQSGQLSLLFFKQLGEVSSIESLLEIYERTSNKEEKNLIISLLGGEYILKDLRKFLKPSQQQKWKECIQVTLDQMVNKYASSMQFNTPAISLFEGQQKMTLTLSRAVKKALTENPFQDVVKIVKNTLQQEALKHFNLDTRFFEMHKELNFVDHFLGSLMKPSTVNDFLKAYQEVSSPLKEIVHHCLGKDAPSILEWLKSSCEANFIEKLTKDLIFVESSLHQIENQTIALNKGFDMENSDVNPPIFLSDPKQMVSSLRAFDSNAFAKKSNFFSLNGLPLELPDLWDWAKTHFSLSEEDARKEKDFLLWTWLVHTVENTMLKTPVSIKEVYQRLLGLCEDIPSEQRKVLIDFLTLCIQTYQPNHKGDSLIFFLYKQLKEKKKSGDLKLNAAYYTMLKKELLSPHSTLFKILSSEKPLSVTERVHEVVKRLHRLVVYQKNQSTFPLLPLFRLLSISAFSQAETKLREKFPVFYSSDPEKLHFKLYPTPPSSFQISFFPTTKQFQVTHLKTLSLISILLTDKEKEEKVQATLPFKFTIHGSLEEGTCYEATLALGHFELEETLPLAKRIELVKQLYSQLISSKKLY